MAIQVPDPITLNDLTDATLSGDGVFDVLMRAMENHVAQEYDTSRIRGQDYSQVYLGALQSVLDRSIMFLLNKDKSYYEAEALRLEAERLELEKDKIAAETLLINAQIDKIQAEIPLINQQVKNAVAEELRISAATSLLHEQQITEQKKRDVMDEEICKLKGEFDVLVQQALKVAAETAVLEAKKHTELAQTNSSGIDPDSVLGKQTRLYQAQTDGFQRDAEQKAASIMTQTWSVRRTTDEATPYDNNNKLADSYIGEVIQKLMEGINA